MADLQVFPAATMNPFNYSLHSEKLMKESTKEESKPSLGLAILLAIIIFPILDEIYY
jgi:hypothetical protein